jgi:ferrochelatase
MKKGLILLNMGGVTSKEELKLFLTNMFNDKNILTIKNDFLRSFIAKMIIKKRLNDAWENYELIGGTSPLNSLTKKLISDLLDIFQDKYYINCAMRYTPPFASQIIEDLLKQGIKDVILFPLYPQYSTTTTKSSVEEFEELCDNRFNIKVIEPFYNHTLYNEAIIDEVSYRLGDQHDYHLIFSAHGLPQKIINNGDPYETHLKAQLTILKNLIKQRKDISVASISLAYQSKVGPMKWLEPSLDDRLKELENQKVIIYPISFIIDNSETVFELDIEYRNIAKKFNIKDFKVCRALNNNEKFIKTIIDLIEKDN